MKDEDGGKRKKKAMVLVDSTDSESDGPFVKATPSKKKKVEETPKKKEVVASAKKSNNAKTKIPETPLQPVDISSVFGNKPIQRSKDIPEKRKRTVIEDHSDEDFEATLQQLDEAPVTKKSKVIEKSTSKGKLDSPVKKERIIKSPAKEEKSKSSASPPYINGKASSKESARVEVKREPSSDKKRKAAVSSPKKSSPIKDAKPSEEKDKRSRAEHKELDSNSNKTSSPSKSNKKIKTEPAIVKETPKKKASKDDDDPDVIDSPAYDALEKRKEKAENYRKFLASRRDGGAKNPGSKPVPVVIPPPPPPPTHTYPRLKIVYC